MVFYLPKSKHKPVGSRLEARPIGFQPSLGSWPRVVVALARPRPKDRPAEGPPRPARGHSPKSIPVPELN